MRKVVIESATLVNGRTGLPMDHVTIVIEDERIQATGQRDSIRIPSDATVIDGRGKWVIPGLVDVHAHYTMRSLLRQTLALGFTTVHVMPFPPDNRLDLEAWASMPESPAPRLQLTTPLFTGEFPDNLLPGAFDIRKPRTPSEVQHTIQDLRDRGFRQIKIIQDDGTLWTGPDSAVPRLPDNVFNELVQRAHELDMRVYVHATQLRDSRQAILAGADAFMHGAMDSLLDDSLWSEMRRRRMVWTPALAVVLAYGDSRDFARRILADPHLEEVLTDEEHARRMTDAEATDPPAGNPMAAVPSNLAHYMTVLNENTRRAQSSGVPIALGSDGGPGIMSHIEMELLAEAGLTSAEVLVAATYGGAVALGMQDEIGTIEPGKLADLVVLRANPLADIRHTRDMEFTIKGGRLFKRTDLVDTKSSPDQYRQ